MQILNLTSADVSAFIASATTFPVGFKIENFADGDAISASGVTSADMVKGVDDGAGYWYIPTVREVSLNLMAGSDAANNLMLIAGAQEMTKRPELFQLTITIPSMGVTVMFIDGVMTSYPPMPSVSQRLGNLSFGFKFKTCKVIPL